MVKHKSDAVVRGPRSGASGPPSRPPGTPSPSSGRLPAAERRAAILKAAFPRFAIHGYDGTTTRDLAAAAGVTEPILYRHFPSKADLFAAVLEEAAERILVAMAAAVAGTATASERLAALGDRLEPMIRELEDEFRLVNGAAATHADTATTTLVRDVYARIGAALSRALSGGGLRRGVRPETAGHLLLELGLGASLVRPLRVAAVERAGYGEEVLQLILRALTR